MPFTSASTVYAASTVPAAPRRWPVIDLVELTARRRAWPAKSLWSARVAAGVERAARALGLVVEAGRGRAHRAEAPDAEQAHWRLGAARQHDVLASVADQHGALADGMRARGAGAGRRVVRPARPDPQRDVSRGHVGDERRDEEGRDPAEVARREQQIGLLEARDTAHD